MSFTHRSFPPRYSRVRPHIKIIMWLKFWVRRNCNYLFNLFFNYKFIDLSTKFRIIKWNTSSHIQLEIGDFDKEIADFYVTWSSTYNKIGCEILFYTPPPPPPPPPNKFSATNKKCPNVMCVERGGDAEWCSWLKATNQVAITRSSPCNLAICSQVCEPRHDKLLLMSPRFFSSL